MQSTDSFHASDGAEGAGDGIRPCIQNVSKGGRGEREGKRFSFNCLGVLKVFDVPISWSPSLSMT